MRLVEVTWLVMSLAAHRGAEQSRLRGETRDIKPPIVRESWRASKRTGGMDFQRAIAISNFAWSRGWLPWMFFSGSGSSQRKAGTNSGMPLFRKFFSCCHLQECKYAIHLFANGLRADRLYNETVHGGFQALAAVLFEGVRGHGHNRNMSGGALFHRTDLSRRIYAIQDGHLHVHGDEIDFALLQDSKYGHSVARHERLMSHLIQQTGDQPLIYEVVFRYQYAQAGSARCGPLDFRGRQLTLSISGPLLQCFEQPGAPDRLQNRAGNS